MVRVVISEEIHTARFESFANAVVGRLEGGIQVMNTSPSWDMARDGRGYSGPNSVYVCATPIDNVDSKAASDIKRAAKKTGKGDRLYFCTSAKLSELKVQEIEKKLAKLVPIDVTPRVLGRYQLVPLGVKWPDVVEQFYRGELDAIRRALTESSNDDSASGLQLALLAIGQDSSAAVRESVYRNALLMALEHGQPAPIGNIVISVSNALKLSSCTRAQLRRRQPAFNWWQTRVSNVRSPRPWPRESSWRAETLSESRSRRPSASRSPKNTSLGCGIVSRRLSRPSSISAATPWLKKYPG